MKFYVLASSSAGNSSYIETENRKILVDAGISYTKIKNLLKEINVNIKDLTDIFITHEHKDHISGLKVLLKHVNVDLYASAGTASELKINYPITTIKAFNNIIIDELSILPLPLSHDAKEPLGFLFKYNNKKLAYITDTGYLYESVLKEISNCDLYFFEANHDPHLLTNSSRPYYLIYRILNEKGHLSNYEAAYYLSKLVGVKTKYIIYAHISNECNTEHLIDNTFADVFKSVELNVSNINFIHSKKDKPLKVINL